MSRGLLCVMVCCSLVVVPLVSWLQGGGLAGLATGPGPELPSLPEVLEVRPGDQVALLRVRIHGRLDYVDDGAAIRVAHPSKPEVSVYHHAGGVVTAVETR